MADRSRVRQALTSAAVELFLAKGYEETTVDEIAEAAGVARRTFFRYFRTKEDAVFPDHDECLRRVERFLAEADPTESPLSVIGAATGLVLAMYTEDPAAAVRRYELTRRVTVLREREIATTSRYQRVLTDYLHRRRRGGRAQPRPAAVASRRRQGRRAGGAGRGARLGGRGTEPVGGRRSHPGRRPGRRAHDAARHPAVARGAGGGGGHGRLTGRCGLSRGSVKGRAH